MITALLMAPLQEQHSLKYNPGFRGSSDLELALYLCSVLKVREKALDENKWSSAITWQLLDNKQTKQKEITHALSSSGTMEAAALFFELMNQICGFAHRKTQRGEWRPWYCIYMDAVIE